MRLTVRFLPRPDETLDAYLVHLGEANGVAPITIIDKCSLPRSARTKRCDLHNLANGIGGNAEDLAALVASARWPDPGSSLVNLCGMPLHSSILGRSLGRVCPACLQDGIFTAWQWEIKAITACPVHGCFLIDQCPACARRIDFNRPGINLCQCGAFLTAPVRKAPQDAVQLSYVLSEFGARRMQGPPLDTAAKLVWFAAIWQPREPLARGTAITRMNVDASWSLIERSAYLMFDWPTGFCRWLSAQKVEADGTSSIHAHVPVLRFLRWALRGVNEKQVLSAASEYLGKDEQLPTIRRTSVFGKVANPEKLTVNDASRLLDIPISTISRQIKLGYVPSYVMLTGKRRMVSILKRDLEKLSHIRAGLTAAGELANALGVTQRCLRGMVRSGLLLQRETSAGIDRGFSPEVLGEFTRELLAVIRHDCCPEDCIPIRRMPRLPGRSLPVMLRAVLTKRINAWWTDMSHGSVLDRVLISRSELLSFGEEGLTARDAARFLRVPVRLITELCRVGVLGRSAPSLANRSFTRGDLLTFRSRYTTAGALARRLGTNSRTLLTLLTKAGVKPVIASDVSRGISSVWRVSEVERFTRNDI